MPADLMLLLPPYFKGIYEYGILMGVEETELDAFEKSMELVKKNLYVQTCDDVTLREYEQLFGIIRESGTSLDYRRRAVLARMNQQLPYSLPKLREMLDVTVGKGWYRLDVRYSQYEVELDVIDQPYQMLKNIQYMTEEIIPAHLLFIFAGLYPAKIPFDITVSSRLQLNTDFYARYNREFLYLDGTWQLDGTYLLNGYREIEALELYPARLMLTGSYDIASSCSIPAAGIIIGIGGAPDTQTAVRFQGETIKSSENRNELTLQAGTKPGPESDFHLRVEKDLWYLDGSYLLDGTKLLDAGIFEYDL